MRKVTFPKIKWCVQVHSALSVRNRILTQVFLRIQDSFHHTTLAPFPRVTGKWNPKEKNEIWWQEKGPEKWIPSLASASTPTLDLTWSFSWALSVLCFCSGSPCSKLAPGDPILLSSGPSPVCKTLGIQFYSSRWISLVVQIVKKPPVMQEARVWPLGQDNPVVNGMAPHASLLAWRNHTGQGSLAAGCSPRGHTESAWAVQCAGCWDTRGPRYGHRLEGTNVSDGIRSRVQCLLQVWLPGT